MNYVDFLGNIFLTILVIGTSILMVGGLYMFILALIEEHKKRKGK